MRNLFTVCMLYLFAANAFALEIEITEGAVGALPIAIVPFAYTDSKSSPPHDASQIITNDLHRSGQFKPLAVTDMLVKPSRDDQVDFRDWRALNVENLVIGEVSPNGPGGYLLRFRLYDVFRGEQIVGYSMPTTSRDFRSAAHQIADVIYETLTGQKGAFDTRIAYITSVRNSSKVQLKIADSDGYNPQVVVSSNEPLMSPTWSPDGRKLAYVSFEQGKSSIWVQYVFTGQRKKLADFKGINGAPAWSPDGQQLAMTLSKDGNPDIYIMDVARGSLRQLTRHWGIDTEASWSPDGKHMVFTSDRGGSPQIYRMPVGGGEAQRVTFEGKYNARASYSPDGRYLTLVTEVDRAYRIGLLDVQRGDLSILSSGRLDESPSFAPNGSMIIYATRSGGQDILAAVSTDGNVKQRLALQSGNVREPGWSAK